MMVQFDRWSISSLGALGSLALVSCAPSASPCPDPAELQGDSGGAMAHVRYLANDALEGRGTASQGERCAATYIAGHFLALGLEPAGEDGSYFQTFEVRSGSRISALGMLAVTPPGESDPSEMSGDAWAPYGFSGSGEITGSLVYAGPGVTQPGSADSLPEMTGRIVVVEAVTADVPEGALYADPHFKASVAQGREAAAVIVLLPEGRALPEMDAEQKPFLRLPVVAVAATEAASVREAAENGAEGRLAAFVEEARAEARNVAALLPGTDPALADELVIVGAHYDHLGYGGEGSLAPGVVAIHNGADDNASGTAALLEVAAALADDPAPRPVLFLAFSGEERGLLGSAHFVDQPTVAIDGSVAMINMDMVGRMREGQVTVFGMATAPEWPPLVERINQLSEPRLSLTYQPDGYGPSDHSSFYGAGMPVLHFFTNTHTEYHRPEDDPETLNGEGIDQIAAFVARLTAQVAGGADDEPVRLTLVTAPPPSPSEGGRGYGPYFGSIPDMAYQGFGVRLSGVRVGGPAANAGLQAGDVIVAFGGQEVGDLYAYTYAMREMSAGDVVSVVVERDGQRLVRQAVLGERR